MRPGKRLYLRLARVRLGAGARLANGRELLHTSAMAKHATARSQLDTRFLPMEPGPAVLWEVSDGLVDYAAAVERMEQLVADIRQGSTPERVWLLEHPALYTAGTSANPSDLLDGDRFPVHKTGRGGEYTYHGPGQRVAYVLLDLSRRKPDVRAFVAGLERWLINSLDQLNIKGRVHEDRVGVWVERPDKPRLTNGSAREDKIAAIGIRLRKWVSFHGVSINIEPDLDHFSGIVPCGIAEHGVTSLVDLGHPISMDEFDSVLRREFEKLFGPTDGRVGIGSA